MAGEARKPLVELYPSGLARGGQLDGIPRPSVVHELVHGMQPLVLREAVLAMTASQGLQIPHEPPRIVALVRHGCVLGEGKDVGVCRPPGTRHRDRIGRCREDIKVERLVKGKGSEHQLTMELHGHRTEHCSCCENRG